MRKTRGIVCYTFVVVGTLFASKISAQSVQQCQTISSLAESIIHHRQFQNNLLQIISLYQKSEDEATRSPGIDLSILAYGKPRFSFDEHKNEAIAHFRNEIFLICLQMGS